MPIALVAQHHAPQKLTTPLYSKCDGFNAARY